MVAPPACNVDLYEQQLRGAPMPPSLPRDLCSALDALRDDEVLRTRVGIAL